VFALPPEREAAMGSYKHPRAFHPLDLEIMDRVYEAAWAALQARDPFRDTDKDGERQESLRKLVFNNTGPGRVDFDPLCDRVLANMPENWTVFTVRASQRTRGW
jgi:hypothetical protein